MIPNPSHIDGAAVLLVTDLEGTTTTGQTRHVVEGVAVNRFAALAVAQYDGGPGVHLFYCDEQWNAVTHTDHASVGEAIRLSLSSGKWRFAAPPAELAARWGRWAPGSCEGRGR